MVHTNILDTAAIQVRTMIEKAVQAAIEKEALTQVEIPEFVVEIPGDMSHGDFSSNIAMVGARTFRKGPGQIAAAIQKELDFSETFFYKSEVAGPGFLNFFLEEEWFTKAAYSVLSLKEEWGKTTYGKNEKIMVEFVSANPTGPMHLGNARGGVIGDSLVSAMKAAGFDAYREFYLNDAGNQIERFGQSLEVRYLQLAGEDIELPEDGYPGEDILQRAKEYREAHGEDLLQLSKEERRQKLIDFALPINVALMEETLKKYRIVYDTWFHESELYESGTVDTILKILEENGRSYEKEGAIWYKSSNPEAEKDEVLIRQNGNPTYFAADIAYHYNKFALRNYSRVINIWGADHHGHVARLKESLDAVNLDGDKLDIILMQLVRLLKDGEPFRMGKRMGNAIALDDLLDMVSVDAARFFFNMREAGSAMDFDLDLAVKEESDNPVYYVQYAPARINSLYKRGEELGIIKREVTEEELGLLDHPSEKALIHTLSRYPNTIIGVARRYDTASLTHYAVEVATAYHKFYNDCRILLEDTLGEEKLIQARLALCEATKITLTNLLHLLKITVPESM